MATKPISIKIDIKKIEAFRKRIEQLKAPIDKETAKATANQIVIEMKNLISKGISTVRGAGLASRMPRYKNPDKYPGKRKNKRPVNLYLTGHMLSNLQSWFEKSKNGFNSWIGYKNKFAGDKERGHAEGVNSQPKRPTIPDTQSKETFAAKIDLIVTRNYGKKIKELTKKKI